jgi:hypothetical protein
MGWTYERVFTDRCINGSRLAALNGTSRGLNPSISGGRHLDELRIAAFSEVR